MIRKLLTMLRFSHAPPRTEFSPELIAEVEELAKKFQESLPREFDLSSGTYRADGSPVCPTLHFILSDEVPGLYTAPVDPDYMMGRTSKPNLELFKRKPTCHAESEKGERG